MSFDKKAKEALSNYKEINFPSHLNGLWKKNNTAYSHIFREEDKFDNLLPAYREDLIAFIDHKRIKLHHYFHHLNSSQAMCLNFFFPLYRNKSLETILKFIGHNDETVNYDSVSFEKAGLEKDYGRIPTSFDFYFETHSDKKFYFEVKYCENEFGRAKLNESKFKDVYSNYLKAINQAFCKSVSFFANYQILRNLIHINKNSFVIFIYPKENIQIRKEAELVKTKYLNENYRDHYSACIWEELWAYVSATTSDKLLLKHLVEFKAKYLSMS